jgi:superfamily II DNA helicase RecQ
VHDELRYELQTGHQKGHHRVDWRSEYAPTTMHDAEASRIFEKKAKQQLEQFQENEAGENLRDFKPLQLDVLSAAIHEPKHIVAHIETGGGKTLIYQLLAQMESTDDTITIVIEPLKVLAKEQHERAEKLGIPSVWLEQGKAKQRMDAVLGNRSWKGSASKPKLLFLTPEMWAENETVRNGLAELKRLNRLGRLVIDEAHYIASCGEGSEDAAGHHQEFRPHYRELGQRAEELQLRLLCLTASMPLHTLHVLITCLGLSPTSDLFFRGDKIRHLPNHAIKIHPKRSRDDFSELVAHTRDDSRRGAGMIFCLMKADAEAIHRQLLAGGFEEGEVRC